MPHRSFRLHGMHEFVFDWECIPRFTHSLTHLLAPLILLFMLIKPVIFKLRELRGAVKCPAESCKCLYNSVELYHIISIPQRTRYLSILSSSLCDIDASGNSFTCLFIYSLTYSFIVLDKSKSSLFYLKAALLGNYFKLTYSLTHSLTHSLTWLLR
jgi:hypothetical protein